MAITLANRVRETSTTTGTGTLSLAGTSSGFQSFVAGIGTGKICYYTIEHQSANEWEVGYGTVTAGSPDTLSRTTVLASSNAGSLVSFSAGAKFVFCSHPASKVVCADENGNVYLSDANINHGMTDVFPTTTYALIGLADASRGGLFIRGATDTDYNVAGLTLDGILGVADPTDSFPALVLRGWKKSGTALQALAATETVMQFTNGATPIITLLGSGFVGIGCTPSAPLQVSQTYAAGLREMLRIVGAGDGAVNDGMKLSFVQNGGTEKGYLASQYLTSSGWTTILNSVYTLLLRTGDLDRVTITDAGFVGIGAVPATIFDVNGDSVRVRTSQTPASDGAGVQGEWAWDDNYFYVCTNANTWKRATLTGGY